MTDTDNTAPLSTVDGFDALVARMQLPVPTMRDGASVHVPMGLAWSLEALTAALCAGWLLHRARTARRWSDRARAAIESTARTLLRFAVGLARAEQPDALATLDGTPKHWRSRALALAFALPVGMILASAHEDRASFEPRHFDDVAERMQRFAAAVAASPADELHPDELARIAQQSEPGETRAN